MAAELKWLIQAIIFSVMALAPGTNDSDGQFVRKIKLRDTSFLSKRQLFIYQKMMKIGQKFILIMKLKIFLMKKFLNIPMPIDV